MTERAAPYAPGTHVLIDLYGCAGLDDEGQLEHVLVQAAEATGATVLDKRFHRFEGRGGVTGVILLKESHISIHTWPETGFAAVDIFLCGGLSAQPAIDILNHALTPIRSEISRIERGAPT